MWAWLATLAVIVVVGSIVGDAWRRWRLTRAWKRRERDNG